MKRAQRAKTLPACNLGLGSSIRSIDGDFFNSFALRTCVQRLFVAAVWRNVCSARKLYLLAISVSEARFEVSTGTFLIVLRRKHICAARVCCCGAVKRAQRAKTLPACNFGGVSSSRILDGGFLDSFAPQTCVQRRFVAAATCAQRATTLPACNLCLKTSSRSPEGCILNNFQTRICLRSAAAAGGRITS